MYRVGVTSVEDKVCSNELELTEDYFGLKLSGYALWTDHFLNAKVAGLSSSIVLHSFGILNALLL